MNFGIHWRPHGRKLAAAAAIAVAGAGAAVLATAPFGPERGGTRVEEGEIGFVLTDFAYLLGSNPDQAQACPNGLSRSLVDVFKASPEGARRAGEADEQYSKRLEAGGERLSALPDGRNACMNPELAPADANFRTMDSDQVRSEGLDLDGRTSPGDFVAPDGRAGIDNQHYRLAGCSNSFQPTGQSNNFAISMYAGEWGVVLRLRGVDDPRNDDEVTVGIFSNADPMQLSPSRQALEYATYALDQDPRFRATTKGRIRDGVLTTEPVDVRFRYVVNSMHLERPLLGARIIATLTPDGGMKGVLAGYTPVEALYDYQYGFRNGKTGDGKPAPERLRLGSANGAARVLGHTCPGVYQALYRLADGVPDAKGRNTAVSTQYRFAAAKAFVVDQATKSTNQALVAGSGS